MTFSNSLNIISTANTVVDCTGTGFSNLAYAAAPAANILALWDAHKNLSANSLISAYTTTATAAATTTLTVSSAQQQYFTGTTTQTVVLPVTSTLVLGQTFQIVNNSTGVVTVESSGANVIQAMDPNTSLKVTVINTTLTTAAAWNAIYSSEAEITVTGDSGSITGAALTIFADNSSLNCGSSVSFTNSGTTSSLNLTDANSNTILGNGSGNLTLTGNNNVGIGDNVLVSLTNGGSNFAAGFNTLSSVSTGIGNCGIGPTTLQSCNGSYNVGIGASSLLNVTSGSNNVGLGRNTGDAIQSGSFNIYLGFSGGSLNTLADSSNIYFQSQGVGGESNTLRIGSATGTSSQQLSKAFICGIRGVAPSSSSLVYINSSNQLSTSANLITAPPSSATATSGFGSVTVGTAIQNTLGYDIQVNVTLAVTVATGATIVAGVGSTSTPTTNTYYTTFTTVALIPFLVSVVVPAGYYLLVNTTGTITIGSATTQVCPL